MITNLRKRLRQLEYEVSFKKPNCTDSMLLQYISQKTTASWIPLVIVPFIIIQIFVIKHVFEPHCEESNLVEILLHLIHPIYVNHKSWNDEYIKLEYILFMQIIKVGMMKICLFLCKIYSFIKYKSNHSIYSK